MAILPGTRIRDNGVFGTITDNPLAIGATVMNSAELTRLGVVSGNHAIITLDPLRQFGASEIVMVTVHTAAATVATIQRGMFGTVARAHPVNTLWVHAAADNDFIEVLTSGTRPSDQYEGQFIFETDTNKLVGFGGVDWAPRDAGGVIGFTQLGVVDQGGITTETDITNLNVTFTVGTGRRIKVHFRGSNFSSVAGDSSLLRLKEGGTTLWQTVGVALNPSWQTSYGDIATLTPSAGIHTYKISMTRNGGSGTLTHRSQATDPAIILVEDIGAA